ncbi:uncharacterized protein [Asterias amurensis]|uniref:uncharacterized protein n=1 Tax=Asterias amurensis TaxID=7602 RepID=UPI003AB19F09
MSPFYVKDNSRHTASGQEAKMCRHGQHETTQSRMTNFPPIAERSKLSTPQPAPHHRVAFRPEQMRCEPHPPSRPRSNSDFSSGDLWSVGRRSISSSNGRSSMSFSSGDNSTVASTDKLLRRRRLSPRRVIRSTTPFPAEEQLRTSPSPNEDVTTEGELLTHRTRTKSEPISPQQPVKARRKTVCQIGKLHQPIAEEESSLLKTTSNCARFSHTEDPLERAHPMKQNKNPTASKSSSERRRRKSMPDIRQKGEAPSTKTGSRNEALLLADSMDGLTRDRIMKWLSEVTCPINDNQQDQEDALSSIDEE